MRKLSLPRKRLVILAGLALAAGLGVAAVVFMPRPAPHTAETSSGSSYAPAAVAGFTPGTRIDYTLLADDKAVRNNAQCSADGSAAMTAPGLDAASAATATHGFALVDETGRHANLQARFDSTDRRIHISAKGLSPFAPLSLSGPAVETLQTRADWAGNLEQSLPWAEKSVSPFTPDLPTLEIALLGTNIASDIGPNANPKIIKIFSAPNGGARNPGGVNGYTNLHCETLHDGTIVPSTCRAAAMLPHLRQFFGATAPAGPHMARASFRIFDYIVTPLIMMGEQLTATMMQHTFIVGTFIDAKQQLETQRLMQKLAAEASKDYHPSDTMCRFGSFMRSVAKTEEKIALDKLALSDVFMSHYSNLENTTSSEGYYLDIEARIKQFREIYCDPRDNNDGLSFMCEHDQDKNLANSNIGNAAPAGIGAPDAPPPNPPGGANMRSPRMNKDIDYVRTLNFPLTVNVDFSDTTLTTDEQDIMTLGRNLYWPRALDSAPWKPISDQFHKYMDARRIFAITNVAHNSFAQIAAMKAQAQPTATGGWNFMKSMMREFGLSDAQINAELGNYPSYYAQMEVLTKKIYMNPDFYTNLMDKPANLDRISASLDAIRVMQMRDQFESALRREMLNSMMVESDITKHAIRAEAQLMKESANSTQ